jgi:hypothetical protein
MDDDFCWMCEIAVTALEICWRNKENHAELLSRADKLIKDWSLVCHI